MRLALGRLSLERKSMKVADQDEEDADMQQVEMLLQAYFIHVDNTFNRLHTMNEYISDTEVSTACQARLLLACMAFVWQCLTSSSPAITVGCSTSCLHLLLGPMCRNISTLRSTTSGTT